MIKNLIFDWSGTLSDDLTPVYLGMLKVLEFMKVPKMTLLEFKREFDLPYMNFYRRFGEIDKKTADRIYQKVFESLPSPKPIPKLKPILNNLRNKNVYMTVLSSHPGKYLLAEAKEYGYIDYFKDIRAGIHDKRKGILGLLKTNNLEPKSTAFIGDMIHDVHAAKSSGVLSVAVTWGYQLHEKLAKENPDYLIDNPQDILSVVK